MNDELPRPHARTWRRFTDSIRCALRPVMRNRLWKMAVYGFALETARSQEIGDAMTASVCERLAGVPGHQGVYHPPVAILYLVHRAHHNATFDKVSVARSSSKDGRIPFHELAWLFQACPANRGLITMDFDEAAYLYGVARSIPAARAVEIGRFKGGSTFLLASALDASSHLLSIDIHSPEQATRGFPGGVLDARLSLALEKAGLAQKVEIVVADSHTYPVQTGFYDLVFLDGDHSYEGVRADYHNWRVGVKPGGHLVFHDAAYAREYSTFHESVGRLIAEIEDNDQKCFRRQADTGSLVHFVRTQHPFPGAVAKANHEQRETESVVGSRQSGPVTPVLSCSCKV